MTSTPPTLEQSLRPAADPLGGRALDRPIVFITGCGRSGTTILGETLSRHEQVHYLNDRFDIWIRPFPKADIWGLRLDGASAGSARVALTAADADSPAAAIRFREILRAISPARPVLAEKLAINNFRIGFLRALVPDARFVNIVRHGVEVAYSIAAKAEAGLWYGPGDRKWALLIEHAVLHGYGHLLGHARTAYERGLLEWRMSVEWAERAMSEVEPDRLLRLRYEDLIADPGATCDRLTAFLGLPSSEAMRAFALEGIRRKNPAAEEREVPASSEALAGETLRRLGYWPRGAASP